MALAPAELRTALTLLAGCSTAGREPFSPGILGGLAGLIGCDFVTFQETRGTTCVSFVQCPDDPRRGRSPPFETDCTLAQRLGAGEVVLGEVEDELDRELGLRYFAALALDVSGSARPLLLARSRRRLGARERELLELLGPPLSTHSRNARTHRLFARALVALGDSTMSAVVLLDLDGEVAFASVLARRLMQKHFDSPDLLAALASELRAGRLTATPSRAPDCAILTIDALGPDGTTLILREERAAAMLLTARQRGIMQLVGEGRRDAEIARELWITTATVRKHLQHVYARLGVHSRTEALALLQPIRPPPRP
jgi:DNA-binding NarL/FixJ family response regulator